MKIKKIAIVGGGTSGWLAANHLGRELAHNSDVEITLIESPEIPTIAVGEGTVPSIRNSLQSFGISETEFMRACDVTLKQGIQFVGWRTDPEPGRVHYYYHPFDSPYPFGFDLVPYWLGKKTEITFAEANCAQTQLCDQELAPKRAANKEYQGEADYAYHLNALKFGQLLAKNAIQRFGVRHQLSTISGVKRCPDGAIEALVLDNGEAQAFDFFVDCSGFSAILLGSELGVKFVDKADQLFTDTALTVQLPTETDSAIPPYTIATAHQAGWIWDIALSNRRGVGFVYSSKHMSEAEATEKFTEYLNIDAEDFSPRKIPMRTGYREKFWHKNCVAIGLAQGFVEPLEATSILVTDFAAQFLARNFPKDREDLTLLAQRYNQVLSYGWERVIDFVKLHYCLSDRTDSDFWVDNRRPESQSQTLRERLQLWKKFPPKVTDFFSKFEIFDVENYLYVLYGMDFETEAPIIPAQQAEQSGRCVEALAQYGKKLREALPDHRQFLKCAAGRNQSNH